MANVLNVLHFPQQTEGFCLPACAQMVLNYLGVVYSQDDLARVLGTRANIGTPHSHITRLRSAAVDVIYATGNVTTLERFLGQELPIIVFVQTAELPHWHGHISRHALVVIGLDDTNVTVRDPDRPPDPIAVPLNEFMLAWDESDHTHAVISLRQY